MKLWLTLFLLFFILDMIKRRNLRTRSIKMLILDESDEMLNKGFKEQIYDVYRFLPPATQVSIQLELLPAKLTLVKKLKWVLGWVE